MFRNRLSKVLKHTRKQALRLGVSCYRIYDHDLPEFPFCIELYDDKLYVAEYKRRHRMTEEEYHKWIGLCLETIGKILAIPVKDIYLKLRQRKPGRLGQYLKLDKKSQEYIVNENGLQFLVNLSDYLDTGLFLDHRLTRQLIRDESKGCKVLNLFAYTGAFSVYAAAGAAVEVVTVDLSKTYLDWARRNMKLNGFIDDSKYHYKQEDVLQYLGNIPPGYFDLVILDPPTFSNSKRMDGILDIQRDHVKLINDVLKGMSEKGKLYFSTNFKKFIPETDKISTGIMKDITRSTTPFDFEGKLNRYCYRITKSS
ncbi:MAG TPA: class I SAM-dependent methyltransferase [Chitinophagaceae bacterium]|nr:class I SAM-dependent methyltransferase [Chitinophagaceae bacterium]